MDKTLAPATRLKGRVRLPGDKSISHRAAMLAAIAEGPSTLLNYATGGDCQSTLACLQGLGVAIERDNTTVRVEGMGLDGLREPSGPLDAGNSGSTIRMLSGILAGQPFATTLFGDESLSRRPMQRIMKPLTSMGASVAAREDKFPPITVTGRKPLRAIEYQPPVPSAQVKSCTLLAGLYADGITTVIEPVRTRDHSEMALREFGALVTVAGERISIEGRPTLTGREFQVPGDLSSATFFLAAALLIPGSSVVIEGVGLNPTRTALLDYLTGLGAPLQILKIEQVSGEMIGDIRIEHGPTSAGQISGALAAGLIDEIPALAVLGAAAGGLTVRDAAELRVKETDRIATIAANLRQAGIAVDVFDDGFHVAGGQTFQGARFESHGDHRIAMAFAVASLAAQERCTIGEAEAASVSFPEFYDRLAGLMS